MQQNSTPSFEPNLDLDFSFDDYNAEPEIDAYNEPSPFEVPANPYVDTAATVPVRVDTRTVEERIADLFDQMATHRKTLEGVIGACTEPQPASEPVCLYRIVAGNRFFRIQRREHLRRA